MKRHYRGGGELVTGAARATYLARMDLHPPRAPPVRLEQGALVIIIRAYNRLRSSCRVDDVGGQTMSGTW